jgi:hypothetical protein
MFAPFMEPVKLPAFMLPVIVALPPTVSLLTTVTLSLTIMLLLNHVGAPSVSVALLLNVCGALHVCDCAVRAMVLSGTR